MKKKTPKAKRDPQPKKQPRILSETLPKIRGGTLGWRFSSADKGGPYAWPNLAEPDAYKNVMETLHNFETMQESEIRAAGSHPIEIGKLCKEARARLEEIRFDDFDELMSFRLSGVSRVWCLMERSLMFVLWWDPEHQICPSPKKHT